RELYATAPVARSGLRQVVVRDEKGTIERLRPVAQAVAALPNALFVGRIDDPPALIVAASEDSGIDAGRLLRAALEAAGGRGGGNARLAQGTSHSVAALDQALAAMVPQET
ncbi:MAG TPA: DHHA1 domain-containing protein, partial [Gemmatimonadales bacterium]|nr:DHHA1 domain-containing protein [Gemmatimonadales bacterium]